MNHKLRGMDTIVHLSQLTFVPDSATWCAMNLAYDSVPFFKGDLDIFKRYHGPTLIMKQKLSNAAHD